LIRRSRAGDDDSFETLVRRHSSRVFSIIVQLLPPPRHDRRHRAREVFAKSVLLARHVTLGRSFEALGREDRCERLSTITCAGSAAVSSSSCRHETQQEDEWFELQMLESGARFATPAPNASATLSEIAERLLAKLEPEDRLVVVLIDRDGFLGQGSFGDDRMGPVE